MSIVSEDFTVKELDEWLDYMRTERTKLSKIYIELYELFNLVRKLKYASLKYEEGLEKDTPFSEFEGSDRDFLENKGYVSFAVDKVDLKYKILRKYEKCIKAINTLELENL